MKRNSQMNESFKHRKDSILNESELIERMFRGIRIGKAYGKVKPI